MKAVPGVKLFACQVIASKHASSTESALGAPRRATSRKQRLDARALASASLPAQIHLATRGFQHHALGLRIELQISLSEPHRQFHTIRR